MSKKILGLDIRSDALSAVLLRKGVRGIWVEAHKHVPLSDRERGISGISDALETITENIDTTGSICVAAIPADLVSFRNIRVPFKDQKKIRQILPFELEPMLPFSVTDLIIDFHPVSFPDRNGDTDIISASIEKRQLETYLSALSSFNIEPEMITVGGYATALWLIHLISIPENWLLIDLGKEKSTIFVIAANQINLVRPISTRSPISGGADVLSGNIRRTLSAVEEFYPSDIQPRQMITTGDASDDPEARKKWDHLLGIPVKPANIDKNTKALRKIHGIDNWHSARMDNALALALLKAENIFGINFCKGIFQAKKKWAAHKKMMIKTAVLLAAVLILAFANIMVDTVSMTKKAAAINRQITEIFKKTFPDIKTIVDPLHQMRVKIEDLKKESISYGKRNPSILTIDILNEISRQISREMDVEITRLVIGEEDMMIAGQTDTFNSVDDAKSRLETSGMFRRVTISSANLNRVGDRVLFRLNIEACPAAGCREVLPTGSASQPR